ncbi:MAG: alpha/beta fold hydrolase [Hyphomicrobiaceae bacterium]
MELPGEIRRAQSPETTMPTVSTPIGPIAVHDNRCASDAAPLALVHGAGGQARDWPAEWRYRMNVRQTLGVVRLPQTGPLAPRRVVAIDLPGHGASPGPGCDNVVRYAEVVSAVVEAIGLDHVAVAGHSMGGAIALEVARRAPSWLAGVVIVGSAAKIPVTEQILTGLKSDFGATCDAIARYSWAREAPAALRETGRRRLRACDPDVVYSDFLACSRFDASDHLRDLDLPALILAGTSDKMIRPDASAALAASIRGAEFVTIAGGGHFFHLEQPAPTARAINAFLARRVDQTR